MTDKTVILLRETLATSIIKDVVSMTTLVAGVGIGVWVNSGVLQVIAGTLFVFWIFARMNRLLKDSSMTVAEARAKLNEIDPV